MLQNAVTAFKVLELAATNFVPVRSVNEPPNKKIKKQGFFCVKTKSGNKKN